jgi:hypothetical protein
VPRFVILLLAAAMPVSATAPAQEALIVFSRHGARDREGVRVYVTLLRSTAGPVQYAFRQIVTGPKDEDEGPPEYTDTVACPAALSVLEELADLPGPQPGIAGLEKRPSEEIIVDGTGYTLSVATALPYIQGHLRLSSNIGTPLAAWIDGASKKLQPCWRPTELKLAE